MHYFASLLGPTFHNRFYLLAGTSFGHIRNDLPGPPGFDQPTPAGLLRFEAVQLRLLTE